MFKQQPGGIYHQILSNPSNQLIIILGIGILFSIIATNKLMSDKNDLPTLLKSYNNRQYEIFNSNPIDLVGECSFRFLIFASDSEEIRLETTLKSIWKLKSKLFVPCVVVVMSTRKDADDLIEKRLDIINSSEFIKYPHLIKAIGIGHSNRKRSSTIIDEFINYLNIVTDDKKFMVVREGNTFCENAQYHLMNVLDEARRRNLDSESVQHVAFKVSMGKVNGFIISHYLLSKWLESSSIKSSILLDILEKKQVWTYRFQIMNSIQDDHAQCYESLVDNESSFSFDLDSCSDHLFTPCPNTERQKRDEFAHDTVKEYIFPSSSKYSISDFENIKSIKCSNGEDCNACCQKNSMKCSKEFFPFINRCDEMKSHDNLCECKRESEPLPISPYYKGSQCVISLRKSKFTCESIPTNSISRLCPCMKG